jgi:survival of motor neuron-related-splicing factor 30
MSEVTALEAEVKEYKTQLETIEISLQEDASNAELLSLKTELEEVISLTESTIAELKPSPASAPVKSSTQAPPVKEKWSKENHPAYQAGYRPPSTTAAAEPEEAKPVTLAVNDMVSARWKSGDGAFYTGRITSITGSSANPVYIVHFKNYNATETLRAKDIKPLANTDSRKRKADGISGSSSPALTPPSNPNVISAAAHVDPLLASQAQAKREPSKVSDGPIRPAKVPRKVKANKELEAGKSKWQDFAAKSKGLGKVAKKESMFRTGESVNARGKQNIQSYFKHVLIYS